MSRIPPPRDYEMTGRDYVQERWNTCTRVFGHVVIFSLLVVVCSLVIEVVLSGLLGHKQ